MSHLLFPGDAFRKLRSRLLESELERGALLLANPIEVSQHSWKLLVSETVFVDDRDYSRQSHDGLEIPPQVLVPIIKRARHENQSIILVHTHPWDGEVGPSGVDRRGELLLLPSFFQRIPGLPHGRLILGRRDTHAALFPDVNHEINLDVLEVGPNVEQAPRLPSNDSPDELFDRQVRAFGHRGQQRLASCRVAIVGLGGTGSVVALQLAHLGIKGFYLVDPDVIEQTNLNRVVGATQKDLGRPKVEVAASAIREICPDAYIATVQDNIVKQKVARTLLKSDFFFSCTDSHGSRAVLTQLAYQYLLPGIDLGVRIECKDGAVIHTVGRVQMLSPGLACTSCTKLLDPETVRRELLTEDQRKQDPYIVGGGEPQPAVISLNTTVSGLAVSMFLAALTGAPLRSRHQIILFDSGSVKAIENTPDPDCAICSPRGFLGRGDSWPPPGRPE